MYARELLPRIFGAEPGTSFIVYLNDSGYRSFVGLDWPECVKLKRIRVSGTGRTTRVLCEATVLPAIAWRDRLDVLHSLGNSAPLLSRTKLVTNVHDIIYKHFPDTHSRLMRIGQSLIVPASVRWSDRIITLSEFTKRDLVSAFQVSPKKIDVTPAGCGQSRKVVPSNEQSLRNRFHLGKSPIMFSVLAKRPHKNILRLMEAVSKISNMEQPILVIPGYPTSFENEIKDKAASLGLQERLRLCGWLSDEDLEGFYQAAGIFVFPSLYEGFGLPILEAMQRGIPVACSNTSSLPEVAGDAAVYFDPYDVDDMAKALLKLLTDKKERNRLVQAGHERAALFTWDKTASKTVDAYARAIEG